MISLNTTTESLEVVTTGASVSVDFLAVYADYTPATPAFTPGSSQGNIASATTTTIVGTVGSGIHRQIKWISIHNKGATCTVRLQKDVATVDFHLTPTITLAANETLLINDEGSRTIIDATGRTRTAATDVSGVTGRTADLVKTGTAAEAVGVRYSFAKDAGYPGAWAPGTPGLAGRATDGTAAADGGCLPIANPTSGANFLTGWEAMSSVTGTLELWDVLWVNSGIAVTTTTAQTINSVAFPARDVNGSTNGEGVYIAILATAATTNVAAVTGTVMSYTNQAGTAGRTATMPSTIPGGGWPATAVVGTVQPFYLQAGDFGVRSIQTITLTTSYGGGSISLIAYRNLASASNIVASVPNDALIKAPPGVRLFNGVCLLPIRNPSATTATNVSGMATIMER